MSEISVVFQRRARNKELKSRLKTFKSSFKSGTFVGDELVIEYKRCILDQILSKPQDMWEMEARRHFLNVQGCINETFAGGPWLDSMIHLEDDLRRMGGIKEEKRNKK